MLDNRNHEAAPLRAGDSDERIPPGAAVFPERGGRTARCPGMPIRRQHRRWHHLPPPRRGAAAVVWSPAGAEAPARSRARGQGERPGPAAWVDRVHFARMHHPWRRGSGDSSRAASSSGDRAAAPNGWVEAVLYGEGVQRLDRDGPGADRRCERALTASVLHRRPGPATQASWSRRLGNAAAERARQLPDRAADSRSDVRLPRRAARLPARVPAPAAERLLDADDDDAGVHARRATACASSRSTRRARQGASKIRLGSRRRRASS